MTEPQSSMININAKVTAVHLASTLVGSCLKHRFSIFVIATVIPRIISSPTAWKAKMVTGIPITAKTMHRAWPVLVEGEIAPYPKTEIQFVTPVQLSIKRTAVVTTTFICEVPPPPGGNRADCFWDRGFGRAAQLWCSYFPVLRNNPKGSRHSFRSRFLRGQFNLHEKYLQ